MKKQLIEGSVSPIPMDVGYEAAFVNEACGDTMWDDVLMQTEDREDEAGSRSSGAAQAL